MVSVTRQFSKSIFFSEIRSELDFNLDILIYDFVSGLLQKKMSWHGYAMLDNLQGDLSQLCF